MGEENTNMGCDATGKNTDAVHRQKHKAKVAITNAWLREIMSLL